MAYRLDAVVVLQRGREDHQVGQRGRELDRDLLVAQPRRAAPALKTMVEGQVRDVAVDALLWHAPCGQAAGVAVPTVSQLDMQPAARTLGEIGVPAQTYGLRTGGLVVETQVHFQRAGRQHKTLAHFEGKGPMGVGRVHVAQLGFARALADHLPGTLPGHTVQRVRVVVEVGLRGVFLPEPAKPPVAEPSRVRHQRVTARDPRARQLGRFMAAQHGQITQPQAGDAAAKIGAQRQAQVAGAQFKGGDERGR